jgi:hypothetical protein
MMDRRFFLRLTGIVAAAAALDAVPVAARAQAGQSPSRELPVYAPGSYQITGRVRLDEPLVEISGITNAQQISWSGLGTTRPPVAGFTSFEYFDKPWSTPTIQVRGGQLESLEVVPFEIA